MVIKYPTTPPHPYCMLPGPLFLPFITSSLTELPQRYEVFDLSLHFSFFLSQAHFSDLSFRLFYAFLAISIHQLLDLCSWPCHSSGGLSPASHHSGLGSSPGHVMCDLWFKSGVGAGFLLALRFPLPILITPNAPYSSLSSGAGRIDQLVADITNGLNLTLPHKICSCLNSRIHF
jgi:hypothetical protein